MPEIAPGMYSIAILDLQVGEFDRNKLVYEVNKLLIERSFGS